MTLRRFLSSAALVAAALTVLVAPPALAHTSLVRSSPAEGATLTAVPASVSLTFGEAVGLPADPIRITGPGGATWTVGAATAKGATVTAPVTAGGPAGAYSMAWKVIADDGDTVTGTVRFTLAGPSPTPAPVAAPTTSPAAPTTTAAAATAAPVQPAADSSGGLPVWVWVLLAVVVLGGAGAVVARRRS